MTPNPQTQLPPANAVPQAGISYEEFLEAYDGVRAEWIDGEVLLVSPASARHQVIAQFLASILHHYVEAHQLGLIIPAPFQMKSGPDLPGREPDILLIAQENLGRLKPTYLDGPADLVVEIVSPDSVARDRGEKFAEYERGGVREYWLIDPLRQSAEFFRLEDGIYKPATLDQDGNYRSEVLPGLWLRPDWLWQDPLPTLMSVLKQWELV
jgi:Uma2 family endonuclease